MECTRDAPISMECDGGLEVIRCICSHHLASGIVKGVGPYLYSWCGNDKGLKMHEYNRRNIGLSQWLNGGNATCACYSMSAYVLCPVSHTKHASYSRVVRKETQQVWVGLRLWKVRRHQLPIIAVRAIVSATMGMYLPAYLRQSIQTPEQRVADV